MGGGKQKVRWEQGKFFKLWQEEVQAGRDPHQAFKDRGVGAVIVSTNIFADLPQHLPEEIVSTLIRAADVRIERILLQRPCLGRHFWYNQPQHEWVIVLKGGARFRFEGEDRTVETRPGDFINIPAHKNHRVEWTTPDGPTVWLGVRYGDRE